MPLRCASVPESSSCYIQYGVRQSVLQVQHFSTGSPPSSSSSIRVHRASLSVLLVPYSSRQLHHMVDEESQEEVRRGEALRRVSGHPHRHERLQLRQDRERKDKRALISWIRRDLEVRACRSTSGRTNQLLLYNTCGCFFGVWKQVPGARSTWRAVMYTSTVSIFPLIVEAIHIYILQVYI